MSQTSGTAPGVAIVGSINIDLTTFSQRTPSPGETLLGDAFAVGLGGKGANQAVAVARAGAPAHLVGVTGDDAFGGVVREALGAAGVDLAHVRTADAQTGVAHIRVDASGENDIVVVPLANDELEPAQIDAALEGLRGRASVLLTQLEIPFALTMHAIRSARTHGLTVVLDPAPAHELDDAIWPLIDVVTPNETEATILTGVDVHDRDSAVTAAAWFRDRGVGSVLVTLAGAGSMLVTEHGATRHQAVPVEVVDTTAAGDAFAGALAAALARGDDMPTAIRTASATGALAVTRRGASDSIPTADEVRALLDARDAA